MSHISTTPTASAPTVRACAPHDAWFSGSVVDRLATIRGAFDAEPHLQLTADQAGCRWGLEPRTMAVVLDALAGCRFLLRLGDGTYVRRPIVTASDPDEYGAVADVSCGERRK